MKTIRSLKFFICSLTLIFSITVLADTQGFKLVDKDCKTMGSSIGEIEVKTAIGSKSTTECSIQDKVVTCIGKHKDSNKIYGSEKYNIIIDSTDLFAITSEKGNVSYIINKREKYFVHSQFNYVPGINGFISKSCVGGYSK